MGNENVYQQFLHNFFKPHYAQHAHTTAKNVRGSCTDLFMHRVAHVNIHIWGIPH